MSDNNDQAPSASFKISMSSVIESDRVLFKKESVKFYKIVLFLVIGDFLLTEFIFIHDYFIKEPPIEKTNFIAYTLTTVIFFILLLIFLYLEKSILSKIARFSYLIIGLSFFIYEVVEKMIKLNDDGFNMKAADYILFIVLALSIIPKITGFLYIRIFERSIIKMEAAKLAEEHEMFIEKVSEKLDRSTVGNRILEKEMEKELEKEEEEIIFKVNNEKIMDNKIQGNKNKRKDIDDDKEEVADMN